MLRLLCLVALMLLAILRIERAEASVQTGNQFWSNCEGHESEFCTGYVTAFFELTTLRTNPCRLQFPGGTNPAQVYDIVMKYMKEFPDHREWSMDHIVEVAIRRAFPCQ